MTQEEEHLVADILMRQFLLALFAVHSGDVRLVTGLVDSGEFDVLAAFGVGAQESEMRDGAFLEVLLGLSFQDGVWQVRISILLIIITALARRILVLFGIDSQTLGDKVDIDSVNVLDETGDRRHHLLRDIPLDIDL